VARGVEGGRIECGVGSCGARAASYYVPPPCDCAMRSGRQVGGPYVGAPRLAAGRGAAEAPRRAASRGPAEAPR